MRNSRCLAYIVQVVVCCSLAPGACTETDGGDPHGTTSSGRLLQHGPRQHRVPHWAERTRLQHNARLV